jgi:hypothetical protein
MFVPSYVVVALLMRLLVGIATDASRVWLELRAQCLTVVEQTKMAADIWFTIVQLKKLVWNKSKRWNAIVNAGGWFFTIPSIGVCEWLGLSFRIPVNG